jgi:hypothetical protein
MGRVHQQCAYHARRKVAPGVDLLLDLVSVQFLLAFLGSEANPILSIITATFSSAAQAYSRVVPVAMFFLKNILGGNTPRKVYLSEFKMQSFAWATVWPPVCLIVCITIVYSVIQPIICGLALVAFAL